MSNNGGTQTILSIKKGGIQTPEKPLKTIYLPVINKNTN
jgi:hypothetical protein